MRLDWQVCLLALSLVATTVQAGDADDFAYAYPIKTQPGSPAYLIELPQGAYAWTRPKASLHDVVIVDASGRQIPSAIYEPAPSTSHPVTLQAPLLPVPQGDNGVAGARIERSTNGDIVIQPGPAQPGGVPREWLFDARTPIAMERIEFAVPGKDTNLTVDIDASDDLQRWDGRVRGASVVTLGHGDGAVDARVVKLDGLAARYYRVRVTRGDATWSADGDTTVSLAGTVVDTATADEAPRHWLDVSGVQVKSNGQGIDYEYTLPTAVPIDMLRVAPGGGDSVARLEVRALDPGTALQPLGTIVITPDRPAGEAVALEVPMRRYSRLQLHSATPLREAPRLIVGFVPDRFVFLPEGQPPYRLMLGSFAERRPAWPIAEALAGLRKNRGPAWKPTHATVGDGQEQQGEKALVAPAASFDWTRPLLWLVLLIGAAVVGGMAFSLLRKPREGGP